MNQASNKSNMGQNRSGRTQMAVRPSQLRPLMPSNMAINGATGPIRRPIFRSQIPVRPHMEGEGSTQQQQLPPNLLEQRMHKLQPFTPQRPVPVPLPLHDTQSVVQSVETAFTVYGERLQADLRDFRALCTTLVVKEHQEKERWHSLCLKIMKERDAARQRMQVLLAGQRELSPASPRADANSVSPPGSPGARGAKRGREEEDNFGSQEHGREQDQDDNDDMIISPKSEYRPMCALRHSPTPSQSPPGSPPSYSSVSLPLPPPPGSAGPASPSPPFSAGSSSSNSSSSSAATSSVAAMSASAPPYTTTFRASGSRSPSLPSEDPSAIPEVRQPPVKRRKSSCDFPTPELLAMDSLTKVEMKSSSRPREKSPQTATATANPRAAGAAPVALPTEFSHVDIMYVPMKGGLVCRACLLNSTKQPSTKQSSNGQVLEPKTFPPNAPWDDLRDHCVSAHPAACVDVARLHPAEIFELRRRLNMA